jgi:hypothetical protein
MDVKADDAARLRPDPSVTDMMERPVTDSQGQLFKDGYPTYADTDKIPAYRAAGPARSGPARSLRILVVLVALVVVAAGATLGLVKAGIIDKSGTGSPKAASTAPHRAAAAGTHVPLVTQVSSAAGKATYVVDIAAYDVTVTTTTGRSWVSIGAAGKSPSFEGILSPNSSKKQFLLGPSQVDVGAGGTKVIVTSGTRTITLTPVSAPFSYQFVLKS